MESGHFADQIARRDGAVTALRHVLSDIAGRRYEVAGSVLDGLGEALDLALDAYKAAAAEDEEAGAG